MNQYPLSYGSLCEKHNIFKAAYAKAGHAPAARRSSGALMAYLADTEDQAIEEARIALQEHVTALRKAQQHKEWDRNYEGDISVLMELCQSGDIREVFRNRTLICTPRQAAKRLSRYTHEGFGEAMFLCRFGGITHAQCMATIERISNEVGPMLAQNEPASKQAMR